MRLPRATAIGLLVAVAACGGAEEKSHGAKTVVLLTVDTLRKDYVGAYRKEGKGPASTPRMDGLCGQGVRFEDARTPVPLTLPAHVTMMTGLPPAAHGVRSNSASRVPPPSKRSWRLVAETLTEQGRCCGAFVSAGALLERYGLSRGFSTYDDEGLSVMNAALPAKRPGGETVRRALAWLKDRPASAPVFLWVHLYDPHEPHARDYATDVETADFAVGLLLDGLAEAGRGDAAVVLASDHGEALGELGEGTHGFLLGESVMRVPLAVRTPALKAGVRSDPVDLADVSPTLLSLAGAPPPPPSDLPGRGRDLLGPPAPADRARVAEGLHAWHQNRWAQLSAAVVGPWKLEDRGRGGVRLLRLDAEAPPWQDAGVPAEGKEEASVPAKALRAYRQGEVTASKEPGAAPYGYGAGGAVGGFLEPQENQLRPDPYAMIGDLGRLDGAAAAVLATPPLEARLDAAIGQLRTLSARDPDDPAVWFWLGRAYRVVNRQAEAFEALTKALEKGRVDAETVLLAMRAATAAGRPKEALTTLEAHRRAFRWDSRVREEEAIAWATLGDGARAARVREQPLPPPEERMTSPLPASCGAPRKPRRRGRRERPRARRTTSVSLSLRRGGLSCIESAISTRVMTRP